MIDRAYIIDDDEISVFLTSMMLEANLFARHIEEYPYAEDALQSLQTVPEELLPQIIFLDLNMPVINGWEFLDALAARKDRFKGKCSVFILTSSVDAQEKELAKRYDMVCGFLQKPLDEQQLAHISEQV